MKEPTSGRSPASQVLTAKALDSTPQPPKDGPKVKVKRLDSLFLISYSDASARSPATLLAVHDFRVSLYIDIPTIDYYNDQLRHNVISRINKKFKVHKLKEQIFASITNFDERTWDLILNNGYPQSPVQFNFSVSSSGSLRYVETIKFLVESCWDKIKSSSDRVHAVFKLQVSPTSLIWFKTFLNKDLFACAAVQFEVIGNYNMISSSTTPFKEYYAKLNDKFTKKTSSTDFDSIIVVTNSTGVKALLTILSDKPLTSYLSKDSLEALHSNALLKKPSKPIAAENADSDDETPLKRDSSSLLSFQNSLITSNKDKSVKVRTPFIGRVPYNRRADAKNTFQFATDNPSTDEDSETQPLETLEPFDDSDLDEEEDDEGDDDEDEDGLSFSVPSRLSRCGSETDCASQTPQEGSTSRRFRSLSLMDPALQAPFAQRSEPSGSRVPSSIENFGDETCASTAKLLNQGPTNIYVHDGQFGEGPAPGPIRRPRRMPRTKSANNVSIGLIPPEFFSRISSPSSSNSSSNTSLTNLNILPGTFSKLLEPSGDGGDEESQSLFKRSLIDKSFKEVKKQPSFHFGSNPLAAHDLNRFALNFRPSKTIPISAKVLDDEDRLMSGQSNFNEQTSDEEARSNADSTSTLVRPGSLKSNSSANSPGLQNLKLQIYGDNENPSGNENGAQEKGPEPAKPKPAYKKPKFTLDLYNDDEVQSSGGWLLGGNAK